MLKSKALFSLLLLTLPLGLSAQLKTYSHEGIKKKNETARVRSSNEPDFLTLPFWDDFSRVADGSNPDGSLWLDKNKVLVSSGAAIFPPSINVATFDGLDENGVPYNPAPGDEQVFGYRDTLVSQPILLNLLTSNQKDSVYLSFSFQAGGNGEPPDQADFLQLDFKTKNSGWKQGVVVLTVANAPDPTLFYDTLIQVVDSLWHEEFQFRLISFGRKSGRFDTWHVDYIYLNQHRHANDRSFPDRTLSTTLGPIFGDYYQQPIKHFFKTPVVNPASLYSRNLFNTETIFNYNTFITSIKYEGSPAEITENTTRLDSVTRMFPGTFPPHSLAEITITKMPDPVNDQPDIFDSEADSIDFKFTFTIDKSDNKDPDDETDYNPFKYAPIDFRFNDTLQVAYALRSAYAYDDGTAEYSAGLVRSGNELAYHFTNVHAGADSIINGVEIYFPTFAGSINATSIRFFIAGDKNGKPDSVFLHEEVLAIERTSNNEFKRYKLANGIIMKNSSFFIGYREPNTGSVRVGLDKSNNTGDKMFFRINSTSSWLINDEVTGSLMIRPIFGPHENLVTGLPEKTSLLSIFPNPNRGEFYIEGQVSNIQLLSATGQTVPFTLQNIDGKVKVNASTNLFGVYIVKYRTGREVQTQKILFIH